MSLEYRAWYLGHFLFGPCSIKYHTSQPGQKNAGRDTVVSFWILQLFLGRSVKKISKCIWMWIRSRGTNSFGPEGFQKVESSGWKGTRIWSLESCKAPVWSSQVSRSMFPPQTAAVPPSTQRQPRFGFPRCNPYPAELSGAQVRHCTHIPWCSLIAGDLQGLMLKLFSLEVILFIPNNLGIPNNQLKLDVWWFPTIFYVMIWFIIQLCFNHFFSGCFRFQVCTNLYRFIPGDTGLFIPANS